MREIKVKTPAKINLTLEVLDRRPDGFHNIQSIMQSVNLYDYLAVSVEKSDKLEINLSGNSSEIPYNESNLVYKAAVKFFEKADINNVKLSVYIEKNIPVSAGLAGGSTNGAGILYALNKLFPKNLDKETIDNICASLGSDINFCLSGGCYLCTSRGEVLEKLPYFNQKVSLIKPKKLGISAKEAYTKFTLLKDKTNPNNTLKLKQLLLQNKFDKTLIYNSLESALFNDYKELRQIKENVKGSLMSGSGSTFFVLDDKINTNLDKNNYNIFENLTTIPFGVQEV